MIRKWTKGGRGSEQVKEKKKVSYKRASDHGENKGREQTEVTEGDPEE